MQVAAALRTKRARIVTIRMTETVMAAARLLRSEDIGILMVKDSCGTEGDVVLGMLSEREILQAIVDHGTAAFAMPVSVLITHTGVSCQAHDTVDRALGLMDEHHIRHLPVLEQEALVGVVSIRDMLALATATQAVAHDARSPG